MIDAIQERILAKKLALRAQADGLEVLERLINEANLSPEDELRLGAATDTLHPAIVAKRLSDEVAFVTSGD